MSEATWEQPQPITLPTPGLGVRARRVGRTVGAAGRAFAPVLTRKALRSTSPHERPAARAIRVMFEDLGATYVKFGQAIASSPAVIPESISEEFRSCLDAGPPIPARAVRARVERELGRPIGEVFAEFEDRPIAAASIAAVHRARLKDGTPVAVKVLRPGIERVVAADLDVMEPALRFAARQGSDVAYNGVGYIVGLRHQVAEELDLRNEARTMDYFRGLFADFELERLVIPRVYHEFTARRVLTMEYMDGAPIDDLAKAEEFGAQPAALVRDLLRAWLLTALGVGAFHADIHAGNLFVLRDGRLAMLDWGVVARLDPDTQGFFRSLIEAGLGDEDAWRRVGDHVIKTQGVMLMDGFGYTPEQIHELSRLYMEPVLSKPMKDVSMAALFMPPERVAAVNHGVEYVKPSWREQIKRNRARAKAFRTAMDAGHFEAEFQRQTFLSAKQLLYLERYGRMYLPDEALLADHDFLRRALGWDDLSGK
ncbi:MAG: ABC1 kinase family protein [Dehalococcoidia bacterium]